MIFFDAFQGLCTARTTTCGGWAGRMKSAQSSARLRACAWTHRHTRAQNTAALCMSSPMYGSDVTLRLSHQHLAAYPRMMHWAFGVASIVIQCRYRCAMQAALNQQDSASDGTADTSRWMPLQHMRDSLTDVQQDTSAGSQQEQAPVSPSPPPLPCIRETSEPPATKLLSEGEEGRRGQRFYKHFVESTGGRLTQVIDPSAVTVNLPVKTGEDNFL